jgi:hypothetical protein
MYTFKVLKKQLQVEILEYCAIISIHKNIGLQLDSVALAFLFLCLDNWTAKQW